MAGSVAEARSGGDFVSRVLSLVVDMPGVVHAMKACRKRLISPRRHESATL
jgi:hypothetical protein